jgi:hypothetical protein
MYEPFFFFFIINWLQGDGKWEIRTSDLCL